MSTTPAVPEPNPGCDLAKSGVGNALRGKLSVLGVGRKAIQKTVARHPGHSFEMFDDLPKSILDLMKLFRVFNVIRDERRHQLAVLDFNNQLSTFGYAHAQGRKIWCSERGHGRIHRLFRIAIRHRVEGIRPPRPPVVRISWHGRRVCLKNLLQEEDKAVPERFIGLVAANY